jgi:hypothetical protein
VNVFGVDVTSLDVPAFLAAARHLFPLVALIWLALLLRVRRPAWLLAGVLLANAYVWVETNWPLQRLYALGPSSDRVNNVALCQIVAAGHSPLTTPQVGHTHFEPFWAVVAGAASGFDPARLVAIYGLFSLVALMAFALSIYAALDGASWSPWERVLAAGFATLLSSAPLDYASPYRVPWAMTFLLKPNHALGLVLAPWVLRAVARIRGWRGRLAAGLLLHLLGWVFVIHMGATCIGLVAFAVLVTLSRRDEARRAWVDVATVIGINLAVVSPYLFMLFTGYGVLQSGPRLQIPPLSPHLLEVTTRTAVLGALGAWGAVVAFRRDRLGQLWAGQTLGALLLWLSYYPLHFLQEAKERDDTFYWLRFHLAVCAAVGAWDLVTRLVARRRTSEAFERPWLPAAAIALAALPFSIPYWWDPARMDVYFPGSLQPLPAAIRESADFLAGRGAAEAVVAGDPVAARWMAALAGTRVLLARDFPAPRDFATRVRFQEDVLRGTADPAREGARWGVTHVIVTPAFLATFGVELADLERRPYLRKVLVAGDPRADFVAVFELVRPSA